LKANIKQGKEGHFILMKIKDMMEMHLYAPNTVDLKSIELLKKKKTSKVIGQVPVAPTCNPSYSGGRDQEDRGLKPAQAYNL
jgi:hypothetical protein